jgi:hypothetical protein
MALWTPDNPMTTAEDIIVGGSSGIPARLGVGSDDQFLRVSSGAAAWASGRVIIADDFENYTGGNRTLNSTSFADVGGVKDLAVAATAGDLLGIYVSATFGNESVAVGLDMTSIVSAAPVNYISGNGSGGFGIGGWRGPSGIQHAVGGMVFYTVVSGDISSGNVTLRLRYLTSSATNKTIFAGGGGNLSIHQGVVNYGQ